MHYRFDVCRRNESSFFPVCCRYLCTYHSDPRHLWPSHLLLNFAAELFSRQYAACLSKWDSCSPGVPEHKSQLPKELKQTFPCDWMCTSGAGQSLQSAITHTKKEGPFRRCELHNCHRRRCAATIRTHEFPILLPFTAPPGTLVKGARLN